ncbi:MAG: peptidase modulator of gyrase [Bryobacterales bacterium]|nr:peptidase modulator of gyrase [Bryobacterales bacterium]
MRFLNKGRLPAGLAVVLLSCSAVWICSAFDAAGDIRNDAQLHAMVDELARSKTLKLNDLDKPYFVSYTSSDIDQLVVAGSLGGLNSSNRIRVRSPQVQVRVGNYAFDNTNSVYSGFSRLGALTLDDDYDSLRTSFWLSTDGLYKAATDQITRKRSALREIAEVDKTPDLAPAKPVQILRPPAQLKIELEPWEQEVRRLSAIFLKHPDVLSSNVRLLAVSTNYRLANSEGTVIRIPEEVTDLEIRSRALAADGGSVWNSAFLTVLQPSQLPDEKEIARLSETLATQTDALQKAPLAEEYSGPVLFEQQAAAQMLAEVMADASRQQRKPVSAPGTPEQPFLESVWASRSGSKVAPDWMTIYDDPLQTHFGNQTLVGQYEVDDEGVPASKVMLVEKGILKNFLLSREPVKTFNSSNGHGRLPGAFGAQASAIGNLFLQADQSTPEAQMKSKLIDRVKAAGLKYGMIIRRLDFPSTAGGEEIQGIGREMQKNGYVRTLSPPLLAFRVYADGREELIRGVRFREFSAKNLRDIVLASDRRYVLNYVNNGSSFDFADLRADETTSSVICPSLIVDSVEMDRARNEATKPPIVPPPALVAQK